MKLSIYYLSSHLAKRKLHFFSSIPSSFSTNSNKNLNYKQNCFFIIYHIYNFVNNNSFQVFSKILCFVYFFLFLGWFLTIHFTFAIDFPFAMSLQQKFFSFAAVCCYCFKWFCYIFSLTLQWNDCWAGNQLEQKKRIRPKNNETLEINYKKGKLFAGFFLFFLLFATFFYLTFSFPFRQTTFRFPSFSSIIFFFFFGFNPSFVGKCNRKSNFYPLNFFFKLCVKLEVNMEGY